MPDQQATSPEQNSASQPSEAPIPPPLSTPTEPLPSVPIPKAKLIGGAAAIAAIVITGWLATRKAPAPKAQAPLAPVVLKPAAQEPIQPISPTISFDRQTVCDQACIKLGYVAGWWGKTACRCFREQ